MDGRNLLTEIHQLIAADVAPDIDRRIVIYLGDYVDRGADSRAVIDELIESPLADFEAIHILGNHELMLLDYIAAPADGGLWLANGGDATLLSYGVEPAAGFDEDSRPKSRARRLCGGHARYSPKLSHRASNTLGDRRLLFRSRRGAPGYSARRPDRSGHVMDS